MSLKSLSLYLSQEEFQEEEVASAVGEGEQTDATASVTAGDEVGQVVETGEVEDTSLDAEAAAELTEAEVEIPETDESVTDEVVDIAEDEAVDAELEADEDVEALDTAVDAVDEADEATASVEHFITVLEHGLKTKTFSPQFAATCQFELEKMGKTLGMQKGVPSLESFDQQTLEGYYTASLESWRGFVKRLWDVNDRINQFIPDLVRKGRLVNGFKKRADAVNKRIDQTLSAGVNFTGQASVPVKSDLSGKADIVNAATADLRLTTALATKGLSANAAFIKQVGDVLVEATNDGGVGKTGAIVAKAAKISPAAASYPEEAFSAGFLGGKKLVRADVGEASDTRSGIKALQAGGIPTVGKGEKGGTETATLNAAGATKLLNLAKAYAALAAKAADSTGVEAFENLRKVKGKADRAHGGGFMNSAGRGTGAEATSWSEGKDLDALATALPKMMQNHITVYRFTCDHALHMAEALTALAAKAVSAGGKQTPAE